MENIFIKTFGCSLNVADSEAIAGTLLKAGFKLADNEDDAVLVIVNTCIVKEPSEAKALSYIHDLKNKGKKVVVSGCLPQALPEKIQGVSKIGVNQVENIVQVVEETLNGNSVTLIAREKKHELNLPVKRKNNLVKILPIAQGCLGNCAYCIVKKSRGKLISYYPDSIVKTAQRAISTGAKEIWLTAQDTGCYGKDINSNIIDLLNKLIILEGNFKIRLGMMNPNYAKEFLEDLLKLYRSDKLFSFIHLPLQSGSDKVLKDMNRPYNGKDYIYLIQKLRGAFPYMTVATDVICGFPTETESQFRETLDLLKSVKPDIVNISRYWKRSETPASNLKQLTQETIKDRSRSLTSCFENIAIGRNKEWLNWKGRVVVDEIGKEKTLVARNFAYKPIIIRGDYSIGDELYVKVVETTIYDLRAIVLNEC
ncbi:MAG: tRNA (N(6)-L-threonylcarbamoyladenosine(37)-C(2))-methylthiotransferase [Nanobdellota archaeon]